MANSAERQRKFAKRKTDAGYAIIQGWVWGHQNAGLREALRALSLNPHLEIGPLRDTASGKLVSVERALRAARSGG